MNRSCIKRTYLLFTFTLLLITGGCAAGPQYIPATLEGQPVENLAELELDLRINYLKIDTDVAVITESFYGLENIFLEPGAHTITYKVYGESDAWRDLAISMKKRGYTLNNNGNAYVKDLDGLVLSHSVAKMDRYGWNKRTKEVILEAGKVQKLSEL